MGVVISINVKGTADAIGRLKGKLEDYKRKVSDAVIRSAFFLEGEVKQSVSGHRAEPKSVDTGRFLGSVSAVKKGDFVASVETGLDYPAYLEYGTSRIAPRRHFQNSAARNEDKVKDVFKKAMES